MGSTTIRVITILLVGILALMVALREARVNRHELREHELKMANLIYKSTQDTEVCMRFKLILVR